MPELPEVEVVRRGLAAHVVDRTIATATVTGARVARRHPGGPVDLADRLTGCRVTGAHRRGKYLWLGLQAPDGGADALVVHLGMSGQLLVGGPDLPRPRHTHAWFSFADGGDELRFVDQRTFGALVLVPLGPDGIPEPVAHIAPDPFEAAYDERVAVARLKARHSPVKAGLLDQGVVSGIGNIYADEALWAAQVHGDRISATLTRPTLARVLQAARTVMAAALAAGGTSFDELYVDVEGASGYFERSLQVYGRAGLPCSRCGTPIVRHAFANRSSHSCPRCQVAPRARVPR